MPSDRSRGALPNRSRRALLTATGGALAALAGCTTGTSPGSSTDTSTASPSPTPNRRPTATERSPEPLDVDGAWPLPRFDPASTGVAPSASGVPERSRVYWRLRRLESNPPVVADDYLVTLAELGADPGGRPTKTRTFATDVGGPYPSGEPYLVGRDAATGELRWYASLDGPAVGWPAVADGTAVVAVNGQLAAFDLADGTERWSRTFDRLVLYEPTVVGDTVLVATESGVRAHALSDGTDRWTRSLGLVYGVAVADGIGVATAADGTVHAFDPASGEPRWQRSLAGEVRSFPAIADGRAFFTDRTGAVSARSLDDGSRLWQVTPRSHAAGGLAASASTVYVAQEASLFALAAADGERQWSRELGPGKGAGTVATPSVGDGVVYTGTRTPYDPEAVALDANTGDTRWSTCLPATTVEGDMVDGGVAAPPAVVAGGVYVYCVDGLRAYGPG